MPHSSVKYKKGPRNIFAAIFIIMIFTTSLYADTFFLTEGSVFVGKIVKKRRKSIVVKNSYGTFRIKRKYIEKMYITQNYKTDIAIQKKTGRDVDEDAVKKDFIAGTEVDVRRVEVEEKQASEPAGYGWNNGRFLMSGIFLSITGELKNVLPYGYGGLATYDQGMDSVIGKRRSWMPGLRFEGGYIYYKSGTAMIKGSTWSAGLVWLVPVLHKKFGHIVFSGTAGMSQLKYVKEPYAENANTLTAWGTFGYEFPFRDILFQVQGRYMFIFDRDQSIHSLGGAMGMGTRLW